MNANPAESPWKAVARSWLSMKTWVYHQRGLTRFLGVAHLVPWTPFLVYLELRLATDWAGPRIEWAADPALYAWAAILWASVAVCLGFDVFDLVRWLRGERFVLGSPEAVRAGASMPAPRW